MVGMRERAESVGGALVLRSESGRGSIVRASIPYESESESATASPLQDDVVNEDGERPSERSGFLSRLFGR